MVFDLFKIKVDKSNNPSLFEAKGQTSGDVILNAIEEQPHGETRRNQIWRIGNLEIINQKTVCFALGKMTKSTIEIFDEETGKFTEEPSEEAPHTLVAFDPQFQVCAIGRKSRVSQTTKSFGNNLGKLLGFTEVAKLLDVKFSVVRVSDPERFVSLLRKAIRIAEFDISFSLPNPFDVEHQFHMPMEQLLQAANGSTGNAKIKGESIKPEVAEMLSRSASGSGDNARARIQLEEDGKLVLKRMDDNPASIEIEDVADHEGKSRAIAEMQEKYRQIRKHEDGDST